MLLDEHIRNTDGKGGEIHEFMDQYWDDFQEDHHLIFHHLKGVEYICSKFGEYARSIAMQHLKDDGYDGIQRQIRKDANDPLFKDWTEYFEDARKFSDVRLNE